MIETIVHARKPLVSIIIATRNSAEHIGACLESVKHQTYSSIEIIVVDNFSSDNTFEIANSYADHVYSQGPERSAQRNYGVSKSSGTYVVIIDSDMVLSKDVIADCAMMAMNNSEVKGIIIPEESFGVGFWAQCKKLERSYYVGVDWMEAARFFERATYLNVGGFDENMVSGEDWDLSQRVGKVGRLGRVGSYIYHNEGRLSLLETLKKKYYYSQHFSTYLETQRHSNAAGNQTSPIKRYQLFFSKPMIVIKQPVQWLGMLGMKTAEFGAGALGLLVVKISK